MTRSQWLVAVLGEVSALQEAGASGPPGDKVLKKSRKFLRTGRQSLSAIADQIEIHLHHRIDQSAHYYFSVAAHRYSERRDNGYAFIGFYHRDLGIEQIDRYRLRQGNSRLRQVLVNNPLYGALRVQ